MRKQIKRMISLFLAILVLLLSVVIFPITVYANSYDPYATWNGSWANCTYWAWQYAYEYDGVELPVWGNAKEWYSGASGIYPCDKTPSAHSIMCTGSGDLGHVAYVTEYNSATDQVYIKQGGYPTSDGRDERWVSAHPSDLQGYIHLGDYNNSLNIGSRNAAGDFNGDGRSDYAVLYDYGRNRAQVHVFLSTGADFSEEVWWKSDTVNSFDASRVSGRFASGDFNGDGKDDIAMMYQYSDLSSSVFVLLSNGSSFNNQNWKSLAEYKAASVIDRFIAGDFNGDGKSDIATMYEYDYTVSRIHVFLSNGNSFVDPAHWLVLNEYCASKLSGRMTSGDFNGDGKDDIATMYDYGNEKIGIHVFLSKANSFSNGEHWYVGNSYDASKVKGRFTAGDFNGDKVDDLAAMYDYGDQVAVDHVWLSQKTEFAETQHWLRHTSFLADRITARYFGGDVNGDGKSDIISLYNYTDKSGFHISLSGGTSFNPYIWNQISGYDCSRTVGTNSLYDDDYSATFRFTKKTIPCTHIKTGIKNAKKANCTEMGYTGDEYCLNCDKILKTGKTIPATGHKSGDWIIDLKPTSRTDGQRHKECTACGKTLETDIIPKLYIPGDINGDDSVNNKDLTRLIQYLSGWDVEVKEAALDVNGDGSVNNKDLIRLFKYLINCDVEIF